MLFTYIQIATYAYFQYLNLFLLSLSLSHDLSRTAFYPLITGYDSVESGVLGLRWFNRNPR